MVSASKRYATGMEARNNPRHEVRDDEDRSAAQAVDPDAGRQCKQQKRQELDRAEHRDLERARIEHEDGGERQRQRRNLRADLADRLPGPQLQEVAVTPEASPGPEAI